MVCYTKLAIALYFAHLIKFSVFFYLMFTLFGFLIIDIFVYLKD